MPSAPNSTEQSSPLDSVPPPNLPKDISSLPNGSSPTLALVTATLIEQLQAALINASSWSGPLSEFAYLRRELHLAATAHTSDNGLTPWILIDTEEKVPDGSPRTILSSCETLRKKAIVATQGKDGQPGKVEEIIAHGIGSVFCRTEFRGKGYAVRMMKELGKNLEQWQQAEGGKCTFNVLYSDIGKKFYAQNGWLPFPSSHISLPPTSISTSSIPTLPDVVPIHAPDIDDLCALDQTQLRASLPRFSSPITKSRVALLPDADTMRWHHAREEFVAQETRGRVPRTKGAYARTRDGRKVWAIWTRIFAKEEGECKLYVLRLAVEGEDVAGAAAAAAGERGGDGANGHAAEGKEDRPQEDRVLGVAAVLRAAQAEAAKWGLKCVEAWNPTRTVVEGARVLDGSVEAVEREMESITSLKWYGEGDARTEVEWVSNEKFGWC